MRVILSLRGISEKMEIDVPDLTGFKRDLNAAQTKNTYLSFGRIMISASDVVILEVPEDEYVQHVALPSQVYLDKFSAEKSKNENKESSIDYTKLSFEEKWGHSSGQLAAQVQADAQNLLTSEDLKNQLENRLANEKINVPILEVPTIDTPIVKRGRPKSTKL